MKVAVSHYTLDNQRQGALLKVAFPKNLLGYADLHPWPELGDDPLEKQLTAMASGNEFSPLVKRALYFAYLDAEKRQEKTNVFQGLEIPTNHFLAKDKLGNFVCPNGFDRVKFKLGIDLKTEIPILKANLEKMKEFHCLARLDFNTKLDADQFVAFLEAIKDYFGQIEFFEDPIPFDPEIWEHLQDEYDISLACDRNSELAIPYPHSAKVLVVKPAIQEETPFIQAPQKLVVTSYLGHPLGQLSAAYVAAKMAQICPEKLLRCGLNSHYVYPPNNFSKQLSHQGPFFECPPGIGFGYDSLLESLPWQEL